MSSILEVEVDATEFALGRALRTKAEVTLSLEEVIPTGPRSMPYFWASGGDLDAFEAALEANPSVEEIRRHLTISDAALFYATWTDEVRSLLHTVLQAEGTVLDGVGADGRWEFTLRFPDRKQLSTFRTRCSDQGTALDVERVYSVSSEHFDAEYGLTGTQREMLTAAVEEGYFEVPRDCTQEELAAKLGIRSSAASETLRRAMAELVTDTLLEREVV